MNRKASRADPFQNRQNQRLEAGYREVDEIQG